MKRQTSIVGSSNSNGFTYVVLLIAVLVVGIMAGTATPLVSTILKAEREADLLFRGQAYQKAIESYYNALPDEKSYPRFLDELLLDPRFPMKRHLRKLYKDPMTERNDWRLLRVPGGGISGVVSQSIKRPLKQMSFPKGLESFEESESYSQWFFEFVPKVK